MTLGLGMISTMRVILGSGYSGVFTIMSIFLLCNDTEQVTKP
jgi:hypothetical protein